MLFSCSSKSQLRKSQDTNFVYFQNRVTEYKIDTCLSGILNAIVELDTNHFRFPPDKFYYELSFENRKDYRDMEIFPSRWCKSMVLDFKGIIKIGQMSFLCRGDIETDPLFTKTKNNVEVQLRSPRLYEYDSIDVTREAYTWKPTLAGKYSFCKGVSIDLYVFVGRDLVSYGTKENN